MTGRRSSRPGARRSGSASTTSGRGTTSLAIFGDPSQPIFEGYTALAALAQATDRIGLGLFVGANTFRNPALAAKSVLTIDHISGGRAMMGLGGAWFELEHRAFGFDFGSGFGQRLDWLAEAVPAVRGLLDGDEVTSPPGGPLRVRPPPPRAGRSAGPDPAGHRRVG